MAVKINFSASHHVIPPTLVLATRSGHKISYLPAANISIKDTFNERFEMVFQIYKEDCDKCDPTLWDKITDFKLCWCKDWDLWFEMYIEVQTEYSTVKNVICYSIGEAELTKTSLYNIEINTEDDINRPDYDEKFPTILYRPDMPEASMLHRIMEKVPHYTIRHVDAHLAKEQRTFSFDDISIYDAFQKISDDLDCVFIIDSCSNPDGSISRSISVYDLEAYCDTCGHRGNFIGNCPECGSIHVRPGYGEDTTIYVSTENLADSITLKTDVDAVSNCFRLETGDGLMTAAVIDSNPNGSQYIWRISEEAKKDMSEELVARLTEYEKTYEYYQDRHITILRSSVRNPYNALVEKYQPYKKDKDGNDELHPLPVNITGYSELMNAYYDAIDFSLFLRSSFMPNPKFGDTTAEIQASRLNSVSLEGTAVQNLATCSTATASNAVAACARTSVDPRYQVKVKRGVLEGKVWTGVLTITNYSDEVDTADTVEIRITLNDDYETFCRQKMRQILKGSDEGVLANSIIPLFSMGMELFTDSIKLFCLDSLVTFHDACQSCLDILVEQGIADNKTWADKDPNLYESLYKPYYNKLMALEKEIRLRESELAIVEGVYSPDGEVKQEGLQSFVVRVKNSIQRILDFPRFFGEDLWLEFIAYRRETTFKGDSYVSDGLDNAKLFKNAQTFLDVVQGRIIEASTPHPSISATLRNLLVMPEFAPIVDKFSVGNWIRIRVDGILYRLRLRSYTIHFNELDNIQIEFSNAMKSTDSGSNIHRTLVKARAMASNYSTVVKQAEKGEESKALLNTWVEKGLDATNTKIIGGVDNQTQTWDSHGMLFRKYDAVTDSYADEQLKIINSTLAMTDDNWKTSKAAIGRIIYLDPKTNTMKEVPGINGEVVVGKMILSQNMGIYNNANTMQFDEDGLKITNGITTVAINPNNPKEVIMISHDGVPKFFTDENGYVHIWEDDVVLTEEGLDFFSDQVPIGRMVSTGLKSYPDEKGLHFTLQEDGSYMCWAAIDEAGENNIKLAYYRDGVVPGKNEGLHLGDDLYCDNYTVHFSNGVEARANESGTTVTIADGNNFAFMDKNSNPVCIFTPTKAEIRKVLHLYQNIDMHGFNILNPSDARLKTNIETTEVNALDTLNQIELKQFDWIENDNHEDIAMIAQQLQNVLPDLVHEDESNGKLSIKTDKFIPYLIKAIQELSNKINSLNGSEPSTPKSRHASHNSWEDISLEEKNEFVEKIKEKTVVPEATTPEPVSIPVGR